MQTPVPVQADGFFEDPFTLFVVVVLLALIFFFYLLFRRTMLGFKEGMDKGSGKN
jgi:branched-subunit amino acid ABC-type transport system permease component